MDIVDKCKSCNLDDPVFVDYLKLIKEWQDSGTTVRRVCCLCGKAKDCHPYIERVGYWVCTSCDRI